jgi:hypothetical protein
MTEDDYILTPDIMSFIAKYHLKRYYSGCSLSVIREPQKRVTETPAFFSASLIGMKNADLQQQ